MSKPTYHHSSVERVARKGMLTRFINTGREMLEQRVRIYTSQHGSNLSLVRIAIDIDARDGTRIHRTRIGIYQGEPIDVVVRDATGLGRDAGLEVVSDLHGGLSLYLPDDESESDGVNTKGL